MIGTREPGGTKFRISLFAPAVDTPVTVFTDCRGFHVDDVGVLNIIRRDGSESYSNLPFIAEQM